MERSAPEEQVSQPNPWTRYDFALNFTLLYKHGIAPPLAPEPTIPCTPRLTSWQLGAEARRDSCRDPTGRMCFACSKWLDLHFFALFLSCSHFISHVLRSAGYPRSIILANLSINIWTSKPTHPDGVPVLRGYFSCRARAERFEQGAHFRGAALPGGEPAWQPFEPRLHSEAPWIGSSSRTFGFVRCAERCAWVL